MAAKIVPAFDGGVSEEIGTPGHRISVDLYVLPEKGRLSTSFGKESTVAQYSGGAICIDHVSRYIYNQHQLSTTTAESVRSKHSFESFCTTHGVSITEYVTDNLPFHGLEWKTDL